MTPDPHEPALTPVTVPAPPLPALPAPSAVRVATSGDAGVIRDWMTRPHVEPFWRQAWTLPAWRAELARLHDGGTCVPCLVSEHGTDVAYLEVYRVAGDPLAAFYPYRPHDIGIHIAIGEPGRCDRGLGRRLLRALAQALLAADPACSRVVAEPDRRNTRALRAFAAAGFQQRGVLRLPDKTAVLSVYPRSPEDLP